MLTKPTFLLLVLCLGLTSGVAAWAETQSTVTMTAPQLFSGYSGSFNVSQSTGAVAVAAGTISYTYGGVTKYYLSSASGRYDGFAGTTIYGINFGPFQIFRSFLSQNFMSVVSAATICPSATDYNWLSFRVRTTDAPTGAMNAAQTTFVGGGNLTYDPSGGSLITGNSSFDLAGPTLNASPGYLQSAFSGATCSSGTHKVQSTTVNSPLDTFGTYFFGDNSFVYISSGGNPRVALGVPEQVLTGGTMSGLANSVFTGLYTSFTSRTTQSRQNIFMYPDASGTTFTLLQANDLDDPTDTTALGTLACTSLNSPDNGFCSGTLTLSGVGGTGNAVCMLSTQTPEWLITCIAQRPGSTSTPISIVARVPQKAVLSVTGPASIPTAAVGGSTTFNMTLTNMTGKAIPSLANPSSGPLQITAPLSNSGAYTGAGGHCGSSLKGYESCTVEVTFAPSAVGTYKQIYRVAYDDGYFGTVNATVPVIAASEISSIQITPATASFDAGSTVQFTATATYSDLSTQDITQAVTWSTSNGSLASTNSEGTVTFAGSGSVDVTASFAGITQNHTTSVTAGGAIEVLGQSTASGIDGAVTGLQNPRQTIIVGTRMIVADSTNHRVLIWNSIPTANQDPPDLVLGQPDFDEKVANNGGRSAQTFSTPAGVASDGTKLYVADYGNNRVLIWNTIPTVDQQAADVVLGQTNMANGGNNAGGLSASSLRNPAAIAVSGGKLFVADNTNNRILIWNTIPTANKTAADVVLGQPDFASSTANNGGISSQTMSDPLGIEVNGSYLWVSDAANNRVLQWNTIPTVNQTAPNIILGQPDGVSSTANNGGRTAQTLNNPYGISSNGTQLMVADYSNHRVLVWNTIPTTTQEAATYVVGQTLATTATANQGGIGASTLNNPYGVFCNSTTMYITEYSNHRIMKWNALPTANKPSADIVIGQPNFTLNQANSTGVPAADTLYLSVSSYSDGTRYFVADTSNHRVLIWNSIPTSNMEAADVVLGQPDFSSNTANNGGRSSSSLSSPYSVYSDGTKLYVADYGNNRVLIWNTIPTSNQTAANLELGQANFTAGGANAGGISAQTLSGPAAIYGNGTKLFVADYNNHRVLIWNSMPTTNRQAADVVLGQPDFVSNTVNNGGPNAQSMRTPRGIWASASRLFVSEYSNNRITVWNSIPTVNQTAADIVLGQPDFATVSNNTGGLSASSLRNPWGIHSDGTSLFVSDYTNNRVLIWNSLPTSTQQAADRVIGQPSLVVATANNGGVSNHALSGPSGVYSDGERAWIVDRNNYRVLVSPVQALLSISSGPTYSYGDVVVGQAANKTFTVSNSGFGPATLMAAGTPALTAPFLFVGGSYPGTGGTCSGTLNGQSSCTIVVQFFPNTEAAYFSQVIRISYNDGDETQNAVVAVNGRGVTQSSLTFTEGASYGFGIQVVGGGLDHTFTVSNASGVTASLMREGSPAISGNFFFKGGVGYPGQGGTCGTILATGSTCTVVVRFAPVSSGAKSATLRLQYNDGTSTQTRTINLTGTGM